MTRSRLCLFLFFLVGFALLGVEAAFTWKKVEPNNPTPGSTATLYFETADNHALKSSSIGIAFVQVTLSTSAIPVTHSSGWGQCPCTGSDTAGWPYCVYTCRTAYTSNLFSSVPNAVFTAPFTVPADKIQTQLSSVATLGTWASLHAPVVTQATATGDFTTGAAVTALTPSITNAPSELVPGEGFNWRFRLANAGPSNAREAGCRARVTLEVHHGDDGWYTVPSTCASQGTGTWDCEFTSDISPSSAGTMQWTGSVPADFRGNVSITIDQCTALGTQSTTPPSATRFYSSAPTWTLASSLSASNEEIMTMTDTLTLSSTLSNSGPSISLSTVCTWSFSSDAIRFEGSNADAGDCQASSSSSDNSFRVRCVRDALVESIHPSISVSAKTGLKGSASVEVEMSCEDEKGDKLPTKRSTLMVVEELEGVGVDVSVVNAKLDSGDKRRQVYEEDPLGQTDEGEFIFEDALVFRLDFTSQGAYYSRNVSCRVEASGSDVMLLNFIPSSPCSDLGLSSGTRLLECAFADLRYDIATKRELVASVDSRLRALDIRMDCSSNFLNSISNPVYQQSLRFIHVDAVDGASSSTSSSDGTGDGGDGQQGRNDSEGDSSNVALPVGLAVGLGIPVLLFLVGLVILFAVLRRKRRASLEKQHADMTAPMEDGSMELYATGDLTAVAASSNTKKHKRKETKKEKENGSLQWEIPFSELEFDEQIGQGCFGTVWRGTWRETTVAIKMFNSIMDSETSKANFKAESAIMKNLRPHTNVTQLFGVSMEEGTPWCLVTEFLAAGNLLHFLQNLKQQQGEAKADEEFKRTAVRMARGIAAGMHHLHSENIVHRDLAARNVLLTGDFVVKVADFGLSTLESDEEMAQTIPIRWTPPEFFSKRTFDKKSDVWSYGVLLWEIVNFGQTPYSKMTSEQVISSVLDGEVLELDENAPEVLRTIAAQCFHFDPQQRPSFKGIIKMLKEDKYSK